MLKIKAGFFYPKDYKETKLGWTNAGDGLTNEINKKLREIAKENGEILDFKIELSKNGKVVFYNIKYDVDKS